MLSHSLIMEDIVKGEFFTCRSYVMLVHAAPLSALGIVQNGAICSGSQQYLLEDLRITTKQS